MADVVDFHRSDTRFSELPDHLRYRPMKASNPCPNVSPRYLHPRAASPTPAAPSFKPETTFIGPPKPTAHSRYLSPRARTPEPRGLPRYTELPEYQFHVRVATAAGFGRASPRLLDWYEKRQNAPAESPRDRVAKDVEAKKLILGWRSVATNAPSRTFDEIRMRNQQLAAALEAAIKAKAEKNKTPSVISEYRNHGTPIRHHTTGPNYVSKRKKDFEGRWRGGGGAGGGRWNSPANEKGPQSESVKRCESRVREYRAQSRERVVATQHVPRVAMLAPSYSLQRWESEQRAAGDLDVSRQDSSSLAAGPSPAPRHPPNATPQASAEYGYYESGSSTARREPLPAAVEVIEGPVTVSVPKGALVRISSHQP